MCSMRCCEGLKHLNNGLIVASGRKVACIGAFQRRAKYDKHGGCKEIDQLKDKKLSPWPRQDGQATVNWQCGLPTDCPAQQPPPNYDPYKIKVPNVLVPPMPPGSAKWMGVCLAGGYQQGNPGHHNPWTAGPGYQPEHHAKEDKEEKAEEDHSFFGILKKWFRGKGAKTEAKGGRESTLMKRVHDLWIYLR